MGNPVTLVDPSTGAATTVASDDRGLPTMVTQGFHVEGAAALPPREQTDARNAAIGADEDSLTASSAAASPRRVRRRRSDCQ